MIFDFSVCVVPLQVILVAYFGSELKTLEGRQLLEGSKMCHC